MIESTGPLGVRKRWTLMLLLVKAFVFIVPIGFSNAASAYGTVTGTVSSIYVNESLGSVAYVTMNGTKSSAPDCDSNSTYVLSLTNGDAPQLFSMLLTARTTGATITLVGVARATS